MIRRTKALGVLFGLLFLVARAVANEEPRIGMPKTEAMRRFGSYIFTQDPNDENVTFHMRFFGYPAHVFVGFRDGETTFISATFTASPPVADQADRLSIFRGVRKRLEALKGREYSLARLDNIDLLGESGGGITDKKKRCGFVFGKDHDGIRYHLSCFAESLERVSTEAEINMTIVREESVQPPSD